MLKAVANKRADKAANGTCIIKKLKLKTIKPTKMALRIAATRVRAPEA
jgi:hypothetical protein